MLIEEGKIKNNSQKQNNLRGLRTRQTGEQHKPEIRAVIFLHPAAGMIRLPEAAPVNPASYDQGNQPSGIHSNLITVIGPAGFCAHPKILLCSVLF